MAPSGPCLQREVAEGRRAPFDLDAASWEEIRALITEQESFSRFAPEGVYALDPRDNGATVYNERRARRPQEYGEKRTDAAAGGAGSRKPTAPPPCPICAGETTPIIDIAELDHGFTFINTNLYPVVAPAPAPEASAPPGPEETSGRALGAHFLQWTSSYHDVDWPELSSRERGVVMRRLALLEKRLLSLRDFPEGPEGRFVSVIKNVGRSVGGSLTHGHQQIALSNVMPRRTRENAAFLNAYGKSFSRYLREENPSELEVAALEEGILLVPYFMRRPYDMQFLLADTDPRHLHELSEKQLGGLGDALALGMRLMRSLLLSLERAIAYNVLVHTGPGAGIYLEFLPWTQENGGYEQLGLSACQSLPKEAARLLREAL
ncbi:MAG: hypothetical protein ACLFPW_07805 [Spirochaetaceae bacterium]